MKLRTCTSAYTETRLWSYTPHPKKLDTPQSKTTISFTFSRTALIQLALAPEFRGFDLTGSVSSEFERRVLIDLVRSLAVRPCANEQKRQVTPVGERLCSHLRTIKRWIVTKDAGVLLHCHTETVYRRVKQEGLPAVRDGRRLKYYPPAIAAGWSDEPAPPGKVHKYVSGM